MRTKAGKPSYGSRAVVTGAGSGIGRAFALELARRGGVVMCADISLPRAQETVAMIHALGAEGYAVECDVSIRENVEELALSAAVEFDGPTTVVINNAGVGIGGKPVGEVGFEDWNWALGINLWGVIHGCEVFTPGLRAAGEGGIINVASAAGFAAAPLMGPYNVGKAAVMSLSETMAAELSGTGLRVSVLCPTFVKTNIVTSGGDAGVISAQSRDLAEQLMRWIGFSPERVARTCLDTLDRGGLYCMPQPEARIGWGIKRFTPTVYTRAAGLTTRVTT